MVFAFCCPSDPPTTQSGGNGNPTNYTIHTIHNNNYNHAVTPKSIEMDRPASPASSTSEVSEDPEDLERQMKETNHLFPQLVEFRIETGEVLLTRKLPTTGAFGMVWLGFYRGQKVAVKQMLNGEESPAFANEILTMTKLRHPKIVQFIGARWSNARDLGGVTEYMDGSDLRTLLEDRKVELSWQQDKLSIAMDVAEALAYLHSLNPRVIHRDLKSRNVLMTKSRVAKLSDFGLSRFRTFQDTMTAGVGTVRWTAPEVMLGEDYSELADMYSFGVVLSELDTREVPYENKTAKGESNQPDMALVTKIIRGDVRPQFDPDCPPCILQIAKACLQFDPSLRPSARQLIELLHEARVQLQLQ